MDFSQFRGTGELSDILVVVEGEEFHLHKFPLFTKSDYFKQVAKDESTVELPNFPGGKASFALIADYCYGQRVAFTPENVVGLRVGAEFLQMAGDGNLMKAADRYLDDLLTNAKMSRSVTPIIQLLAHCGQIDSELVTEICEKCFTAIGELWLRPLSRYSNPLPPTKETYVEDVIVAERLVYLPLEWFLRLIEACKSSEAKLKPLAELVTKYLSRVFQSAEEREKEDQSEEKPTEIQPEVDREIGDGAGSDTEADVMEREERAKNEASKDANKINKRHSPRDPLEALPKTDKRPGEILDLIILALPEKTPLAEVITVDWIMQTLEVSERENCQCRRRLLLLAGNLLDRFSADELKDVPASTLCEIIDSSVRDEKVVPEVLTCVLDKYLVDLAEKNELTADDFIKLAKKVPDESRETHDILLEVLEKLFTSGEDIPDEKKKEILAIIDLSRCTEKSLRSALEKNVIPAREIAQAALKLAERLRKGEIHDRRTKTKYPIERSYALRPTAGGYTAPYSYSTYVPSTYSTSPPSSFLTSAAHAPYHDPYEYSTAPVSSMYLPSRGFQDTTGRVFEDNLRAELNRISDSYDYYLRDRERSRVPRHPHYLYRK